MRNLEIVLIGLAMLALAFSAGTKGTTVLATARAFIDPAAEEVAQRNLVSPDAPGEVRARISGSPATNGAAVSVPEALARVGVEPLPPADVASPIDVAAEGAAPDPSTSPQLSSELSPASENVNRATAAPATPSPPSAPTSQTPTSQTPTSQTPRATVTPTRDESTADRVVSAPPKTTPPAATTPTSVVSPVAAAPAPVRAATLFVSPKGADRSTLGRVREDPLATPSYAASIARPGDTIVILSGTYEPLVISSKQGLTFEASGDVTLTSGSYERQAGVLIEDSRDIVVEGIRIERSLWGIRVDSSTGIALRGNTIRDVGQEAIHVLSHSSDVTIEGNVVSLTGQRPGDNGRFKYADLGEGIYLGTGGKLPDGQIDEVSNVRIIGNDVSNTSAEAIEIKASVSDVLVRGNLVHDIDLHSGAAVSIGRGTRTYDANVVVENNAIWNVTTRNQWADGIGIRVSSTAVVENNAIWNVQHFGIKIDDELRNVNGVVDVRNNLIFDAGLSALKNDAGGTGVPITIEGTIQGGAAEDLLSQLGQRRPAVSPTVLISHMKNL